MTAFTGVAIAREPLVVACPRVGRAHQGVDITLKAIVIAGEALVVASPRDGRARPGIRVVSPDLEIAGETITAARRERVRGGSLETKSTRATWSPRPPFAEVAWFVAGCLPRSAACRTRTVRRSLDHRVTDFDRRVIAPGRCSRRARRDSRRPSSRKSVGMLSATSFGRPAFDSRDHAFRRSTRSTHRAFVSAG